MHYVRGKHDIFTPKWLDVVIILQSIFWMFNRDYDPDHGIGLSYVLVWGRFDDQLITAVFLSLNGIDIEGKFSHKIFWIYNPVQTTYLYFVLTMVITTYVGALQKRIYKGLTKFEK